jgi:hypothetical protein
MSQKSRKKIHDSDVNIFVATTAKVVAGIIEFRHSFLGVLTSGSMEKLF